MVDICMEIVVIYPYHDKFAKGGVIIMIKFNVILLDGMKLNKIHDAASAANLAVKGQVCP